MHSFRFHFYSINSSSYACFFCCFFFYTVVALADISVVGRVNVCFLSRDVAGSISFPYTVWKALLCGGIRTPMVGTARPTGGLGSLNLGVVGGSGEDCRNSGGWPFSLRAQMAGGRGRWLRGAVLCTMDWVDEAPERELPEREDDSELGLTSLALGASASSLYEQTTQITVTC